MHALPIQIKNALDQSEHVSELLNGWLRDSISNGASPDEMVEGLVQMGRPPEISSMMVALAHKGLFLGQGQGIDPRMVARSHLGSPEVLHGVSHWADGGDRQVRKILSTGQGNLEVIVYDDFVTSEEIAHLMSTTRDRMEPSAVVGPGFTNVTHQARTSSGAFIDVGAHPLIRSLEERIARVTGIPVNHGEAFQVLHYAGTQEYQPHYDFFEPDSEADRASMVVPGNRVGTMLFYLSDVDEGGSTYFPKLDLAIHPKPGQALWFRYLDADGVPDYRSEHAGLPVIKGEKWLATKWLRERPITQPPVSTWAKGGQAADDVGSQPPKINTGAQLSLVKK